MTDEALQILRRLEAMAIERMEMSQLGHRIIFDTKTGMSKNIPGLHVDPRTLNESGIKVKGAA